MFQNRTNLFLDQFVQIKDILQLRRLLSNQDEPQIQPHPEVFLQASLRVETPRPELSIFSFNYFKRF